MVQLDKLLKQFSAAQTVAPGEYQIHGLASDSREVTSGTVFFAFRGESADGRAYISNALKNGASLIVAEREGWSNLPPPPPAAPIILVSNARSAFAAACAEFYGLPTEHLFTIGVTGTNGKTSVAWILSQALSRSHERAAYVGTLGFHQFAGGASEESRESPTTTPDPKSLSSFLAEVRRANARATVIEASSHGLVQERLAHVEWDRAIFTNLSRDHLDYHRSFEEYGKAKALLFQKLLPESRKRGKAAIINIDDSFGRSLFDHQHKGVEYLSYSAKPGSAASGSVLAVQSAPSHTRFEFLVLGSRMSFETRLIGEFNIINALTAALVLASIGMPAPQIEELLSNVHPVPGRLELIADSLARHSVAVFIDYAHTPDALVRAQNAVRPYCSGRLITVFGCGGDRDRGKRSLMGEAVREHSDLAFVTSDNPRSEEPQAILNEILPGLVSERNRAANSSFHYEVIVDRAEAIRAAIREARAGDVVLVAGKGHEEYQEVNGVKYPFSDRDQCTRALESRFREV